MADQPISNLAIAPGTLAGTEPIPLVKGGVTVSATALRIANTVGLERQFFEAQSVADDSLVSAASVTWPVVNTYNVAVPSWAVRAIVQATIGQAFAVTDTLNHQLRVHLAALSGTNRRIRWVSGSAGEKIATDVNLAAAFDVSSLAGTTVTLETNGQRSGGLGAMKVNVDSVHTIDIQFFRT